MLISRIICLSFITTIMGCASIGAYILPKEREKFNGALITSEEQQLLLNVVRMRFEDRPYFVSVDNITTSKTISVSNGAAISASPTTSNSLTTTTSPGMVPVQVLSNSFSSATSYGLTPNASYSDSPTVSYTPLQGEKFIKHMLAPFRLKYLYLLLESGWSAELLLRITLHHIYIHENVANVSMTRPPSFTKFLELIELLQELKADGIIYYKLGELTEIKLPLKQH
jgi:hypothetical protein